MNVKYYYFLNFFLKADLTSQFEYSFTKVMEAHQFHKKGLGSRMSFQRSFVGNKDIITLVLPLESLGEMDKWMHTPEIVIEHYGKEEGIRILQLYCDATDGWESRITRPYELQQYFDPEFENKHLKSDVSAK